MNTEKIIKDLLDPSQYEKYETVKWLIGGPRASGRTYLLALAFVHKSINTDLPVTVFDHSQNCGHTYYIKHIFRQVCDIVYHIKDYDVVINENMRTIYVKRSENKKTK